MKWANRSWRPGGLIGVGGTYVLLLLLILGQGAAFGAYRKGFTVSVIHDGYPVKEIEKRAAIPFDSEYRLRLKNDKERRCTARVFIDGCPVSKIGDIVVPGKGELDLERYLDSSLLEGRRFRFVPLDDPRVDDPTKPENGLIRVEFRLEKERLVSGTSIILRFPEPDCEFRYPEDWWNNHDLDKWKLLDNKDDYINLNDLTYYSSSGFHASSDTIPCSMTSATAPGATVEGPLSDQRFTEIQMDVDDEATVVELRIVGIVKEARIQIPKIRSFAN